MAELSLFPGRVMQEKELVLLRALTSTLSPHVRGRVIVGAGWSDPTSVAEVSLSPVWAG